MRALAAGVDALCVGHDLGEDAVDRIRAALVAVSTKSRLREAAGRIAALADWARPAAAAPTARVRLGAARRALLVEGDVALRRRAGDRRAAPAGEHRRRRGRARAWATRSSSGRASWSRAADVYVVRDAHRHPWMRRRGRCARRDRRRDGAAGVAAGARARLRRDVRRRPRVARRRPGRCSACDELISSGASRPARRARAADREAAGYAEEIADALPAETTCSTS